MIKANEKRVKANENRMEVDEKRTSRWVCEVTRMDRISNVRIRETKMVEEAKMT